MKKRILSVFLSLCMVLALLPGTAYAEYDNTCGENCTYSIDWENGTVTVSGTGPMEDYPIYYSDRDFPWWGPFVTKFGPDSNLKHVIIEDGVTYIGAAAFFESKSLETVSISSSVTTIGSGAFGECTKLTSVTIPKSVTRIERGPFSACPDLTIYCYKNSCAHQYAEQCNIPFVLLDGEPDKPETSIQSVTLMRNGGAVDLLTQPADFTKGSADTAVAAMGVDWDSGETGRVFLIQDRDKYVELPTTITPGTAFEPDTPIYAIATNADADELLDWKLTKLRIAKPSPDDLTLSLSLWDDKSCKNEITRMTNTYGSFSWNKNGTDNSDFDTVFLKLDYTGTPAEGSEAFTLVAPEGFSFYPDVMIRTKEISLYTDTDVYPVYPIYSEAQETELVFTVTGSDASLTIPVEKNNREGAIYYRDSFDKKGALALKTWQMEDSCLDGFSRQSTEYNQHLAMLSVALSAAAYKYDGIRATLRNFGFSNIDTHDSGIDNSYHTGNDQISLNQNSVASAFATKKYIIDGNVYTIVAVVIRGTVEDEWYSNFDIGSGSTHYGFFLSKQDVLKRLVLYMNKLQNKGLKAEQTKLLITGHSRAAAVADLLAVDLNTEYSGKYAGYEDTYTYTFATPNSMASVNGSHNNIYNIRNYQDIVTHVPGTFRAPGKSLYVNYPGSDNYTGSRNAFQKYFDTLVTPQSLYKPQYYDWGDKAADVIASFGNMNTTDLANEYGPAIADLLLGKITSEKTADIIWQIGKFALDQIRSDGLIGVGEVISEAAAAKLIAKYCEDRIWSNHAIETYMCWMKAISDRTAHFTDLKGARVKIMCPVDVTVYDENHQVVSRIINNTVVQSTGPYCGVSGEEKVFYLANSDYTFEITGYAAGSMDIEITEYDEDNREIKFINYAGIPVEQDKTVSLAAENCGDTNSRYWLIADGDEVEPDHTASGADIGAVQISVSAEGQGYVTGGGNYTAGERVTLYAVTDDSTFNGWYMDGTLVSSEGIYQFSAEEDAHIIAKFTKNPSSGSSGGSSSGSSGGTAAHPITVPPATDGPSANPFTDMSKGVYYYNAVLWALEKGITNGVSATTFGPDAACTRAQIVTFLWRAAGAPAPESSANPFTDVPAGAYYYEAVLWAAERGITNGTGAAAFSPDAVCTRAQAATFLWRTRGAPSVSSGSGFSDVPDSAYYASAVKWAVANGITNGTGSATFSPDSDCTRGQIVTFLYRDRAN